MRTLFFIITILFLMLSCTSKKRPLQGVTEFQRELNAEFKDASTSPLKDKDRKHFKSLDFFNHDTNYVVKAKLVRTPNSEWFEMKTTTERVSNERVYGILYFILNGESHRLNVYQEKELMTKEGFEDYLFLPFLDKTNGLETYGGGRYLEARIPQGDSLIIDFNKAYNPYCAYNEKFSCPIVPRSNFLNTRVEAGVKVFIKH